MKRSIALAALCALPVLGMAEYQIDIDPTQLPAGATIQSISGCFDDVSGPELGCYDAVWYGPDGFPVMYHGIWANDAEFPVLAMFSSMTLLLDCNGFPLEYTLNIPPLVEFYFPGPPWPPIAPTNFGVDGSIDCSMHAADATDQPGQFMLAEAHPNPFNPSTTIQFTLAETGPVDLGVFDITGRRVTTLETGMRSSGEHEVVFDGSALASGLYLVKLETGREVAVKKVVLAK
ncbi:MAG: T9SS type A sorting domain-containing protein [Calditrichaeota bacterium]|nr:T9SS type A sorting domain-containing protein [Candidatus Cloacimonadota bacterium]MCB1045776.1 T9SS type A sorting domain-containing protein [Calditrichota bacterium]MCB9475005.1 T9SS type A sorting domain-containing protein [Candidatus Delongbacteria bacterium]